MRDDEYRLSFLCITLELPEGILLFNNLTKELILIKSLDDERKYLIENWFLVPLTFDERKTVKNIREILLSSPKNRNTKGITILPTTACNAHCFYCFERNMTAEYMKSTTALKVVDFIKRECTTDSGIRISWFGGEPLYYTDPIDLICSELHKLNIPFVSFFVTNGFLLSSTMLEKAIQKWNLTSLQITLDGPEHLYNKTKAYIYPNCNAFDTVVENIINISKTKIRLTIRLNVDLHNIKDMFELIDILSTKIVEKSNIFISIFPLFECAGAIPHLREETVRQSLYSSIKELWKYCINRGFLQANKHLLTRFHTNSCVADDENSIIVLPNGDLIRCDHINDNRPVGNVTDSLSSFSTGKWKDTFPELPICSHCPHYSDCIRLIGCKEASFCSPSIIDWKTEQIKTQMFNEYQTAKKNS